VQGYCVDVREPGDANWHSLCEGSATITYGTFTAKVLREYGIEPVPVRSADGVDKTSWLPRYFAQWRGKSLIVNDMDAYLLGGGAAPATPPAITPELPPVQLLYGHDYEFRTRLLDLTGGTPDPGLGAGSTPVRRHLPHVHFAVTFRPKRLLFHSIAGLRHSPSTA